MRQNIHDYFLSMLPLVASRGTCVRRQVASIITTENGRILSAGYNGSPSGFTHCIDTPCEGANDQPGNTKRCAATHAEANALLHCYRLDLAKTMYCSVSPCLECAKLILTTNIYLVVVTNYYSDTSGIDLLRLGNVEVRVKYSE